jgi:hypothetical protein
VDRVLCGLVARCIGENVPISDVRMEKRVFVRMRKLEGWVDVEMGGFCPLRCVVASMVF